MSLIDIKCQDKAISRLQRSLASNRLAQAYIFSGPEGIGKYLTARELAKTILCRNPLRTEVNSRPFLDSCGKCDSCLLFEGNGHPDFNHIYKELVKFSSKSYSSRTSPVDMPKDVVQEYLIDKVNMKPVKSEHTVFVVSESEKMNAFSQNALLKTLEEPPTFCTIILLCSKPDRLLPTIHSRCQQVRFGMVDRRLIVSRLVDQGCREQEALYWAGFTQGSLGESLEAAKLKNQEFDCFKMKQNLIKMVFELKLPETLEFADWISQQVKNVSALLAQLYSETSKSDLSRRAQRMMINIIISAFSDLLRLSSGVDFIVNTDQSDLLNSYTETINPVAAARFVEKCNENLRWVDRSVNEKLNFEELLLTYVSSDIIR
ncbi:DNA polymerase III subunit gamma/tau [Limihaloglobus sulfuriphilus]|uniref:DNA polymerase III subunit gamma/tau n=1 Tax=Limihaloglobus sulfuriphilus TaxID=1851148 RepID=A0A1Q2MBN6_9BACT|nr:DNA polymerase III subunit delta' [Limihaloglobus sulfuriphilus]AQQ70084.1 DNA polymerase III subunit gamma/tau [Limihaloglobus sulfuriphilus]